MKKVEKRRLSGAHITMIVLASSFVLLLAAYFIITAIAASLNSNDSTKNPPDVREELGEAIYLNSAIAYPQLEESEILHIYVDNKNGSYDLIRMNDGNGPFWLLYTDPTGKEELIPYTPPILDAENSMSYEELYALEKNDGYGTIYKLSYLCSALGTPYFNTRIDLPTGTDAESLAKKQVMLEKYGFGEKEERVSFEWGERDKDNKLTGNGGFHHIIIGGKALNGVGYYYRVDGRDCIYYTSSNYYDYALAGFHSFVNGMLVSKGLAEDSAYGPLLTTEFKEWMNTVYKEGAVIDDANVITWSDVTTPIKESLEYTPDPSTGGYLTKENISLDFDLSDKSNINYKRLMTLLVGKNVGDYGAGELALTYIKSIYDSSNMIIDYSGAREVKYTYSISEIEAITNYPSGSTTIENTTVGTSIGSTSKIRIKYTYSVDGVPSGETVTDVIAVNSNELPSDVRSALRASKVGPLPSPIEFDITHSVKEYEYTITAIEAIIGDTEEITIAGATVGANNLVRVTYSYKIDGTQVNTINRHAVLDLSALGIPADALEMLRASTVGTLPSPITFSVEYTGTASAMKHGFVKSEYVRDALVLSSIVGIYDKNGATVSKITDETTVLFKYYKVVNGKEQEPVLVTRAMKDIKDNESWGALYDVLLGKGVATAMNTTIYETVRDYEMLRDFDIRKINTIRHFVKSELVVSFKFANASERDPFYGESFFENTMDSKYELYGLNANVAESVVKVLGGIGETATSADGLAGDTVAVGLYNFNFDDDVVAIGLDHEMMLKYNLYDYKIFFEVPRGIYDKNEVEGTASEDELSDYAWQSTLAFTLYVSREDPETGKRYVGSDMYNLVAEVDGDKLEFLNHSFTEFWARKYLFLMDAINIDTYEVDLNMDDVYGKYSFDITGKYVYVGKDKNGKLVVHDEYKEGISTSTTPQLKFWVDVLQHEGAMPTTELAKLLDRLGTNEISVSELYNEVMGGGKELYLPNNSIETVGVSNFILTVRVLENMMYTGTLTEEEQAAALATEKLMSIKVKTTGKNASPYYYVYEFYRATDRKIMVRLYQVDGSGAVKTAPVSDFYLSAQAFKRIVYAHLTLLNAEDIDFEIPYPDEVNGG